MRTLAFFSVILCGALVACNGTTSNDTTGAGGAASSTSGSGGNSGASLEEVYCGPLAALICQRASSCGCGAVLPSGSLDEAACVSAYTKKCLIAYAPLATALAAGEARLFPEAAAACVSLVASSTPGCESPRGTITQALCPAWFTGDAALGAPCTSPICGGGAGFCDQGTCVKRPGEGAKCDGTECAAGLICDQGICAAPKSVGAACVDDVPCTPPLRCVAGACAELAPKGSACGGNEACAQGLVCADGLCADAPPPPCNGEASCGNLAVCATPRRCIEKGGAGAACDTDGACQPGFGCDPMKKTCAPYPGEDEPCANGTLCGPGLACTSDFGNCGPIPGDGQPCAFGPMGPSVCADGLGCNGDTCGSLPGAGQPCTNDYRCAAGLGCDFLPEGSVCVPLKDAGGSCENDRVCKPGLHCDAGGVCAADLVLGTPCAYGNECGAAGACLPDSGGQFVCAPKPGLGERCLFECQSQLHCAIEAAAAICAPAICLEL